MDDHQDASNPMPATRTRIDCTQASYRFDSSNLTVILTGNTGAGKSSTGNSLLGQKGFGDFPVARKAKLAKDSVDGIEMSVIDTKGAWQTQLDPDVLVEVGPEYIVALVINLDNPQFHQAQLEAVRALQGPDGAFALRTGRCVAILSHADSALHDLSLTEYLREIEGDPLHTFLTQDLKGNMIAINNNAETEYEKTKQQQSMLNVITRASYGSVADSCSSCCGCRCSKAGCESFWVVAGVVLPILTLIGGIFIGFFAQSPFNEYTHCYIIGGVFGALTTMLMSKFQVMLIKNPKHGFGVLAVALLFLVLAPSQYTVGALLGCMTMAFWLVGKPLLV